MKIGILTFHEIYNPGAYLQAYATLKTLRDLGHDANVINYTAPKHRFRPWKRLVRRPHGILLNFREWVDSFIRNNAFAKVLAHLRPTRRLKSHADLESEHFDAVIVGSDIVWNYQSKQWGDDPVYFGHHLNCDKLVAYAASCGSLDINLSPPAFVKEGLGKFNAISVRDPNTAEMVNRQTGISPKIVLDPTFLLNMEAMKLPACKYAKPYLLVYAMPRQLSQSAIYAIISYAKKKKMKIISICYRNAWADINDVDVNPFDWLTYINNADCVFTNTFHGTIFSIRLRKRFATEFHDLVRSKTKPLLESLNLFRHVLSVDNSLENILLLEPDYAKIESRIHCATENNINFLKTALSQPHA